MTIFSLPAKLTATCESQWKDWSCIISSMMINNIYCLYGISNRKVLFITVNCWFDKKTTELLTLCLAWEECKWISGPNGVLLHFGVNEYAIVLHSLTWYSAEVFLFQEGEWKTAVGHLSSEIDGKMDRLEFGPFRDELERQLRALANKLSTLQTGGNRALTDDEAAGIRKQLLQRFHCISCDKPLDMAPQR